MDEKQPKKDPTVNRNGATLEIYHDLDKANWLRFTREQNIFATYGSQYVKDSNTENKHHIVLETLDSEYEFLDIVTKLLGQDRAVGIDLDSIPIINQLFDQNIIGGKIIKVGNKHFLIVTAVEKTFFTNLINANVKNAHEIFSQLPDHLKYNIAHHIQMWKFTEQNLSLQVQQYRSKLAEKVLRLFIDVNENQLLKNQKEVKHGLIAHEFVHFEQNITYFEPRGILGNINRIFSEKAELLKKSNQQSDSEKLRELEKSFFKLNSFMEAQAILAEARMMNAERDINRFFIYWRYSQLAYSLNQPNQDSVLKKILLELSQKKIPSNPNAPYLLAMTMLASGDFSIIDDSAETNVESIISLLEKNMDILADDIHAFVRLIESNSISLEIDKKLEEESKHFANLLVSDNS